jgi:AcrR family transcriptional regulator
MSRQTIVPELLELFRKFGYDGVTIARISEATGLGKASLYHHFPQGKEQMAREVLSFVDQAVNDYFVAPLRAAGSPKQRLTNMAKVVEEFYDCGNKSCLIEGLTLGDANELFQELIGASVESWLQALAEVGVEAGLPKKIARERAENIVIAIQGALVLSRALGNRGPFRRIIRDIPSMLLGN